ncbi:MAG: multicopper oxidase type 2 [Acidobacteriaceae bacterium]|nr:multicopper oxidase type 2 [Acidobacteriaceae bacterium]
MGANQDAVILTADRPLSEFADRPRYVKHSHSRLWGTAALGMLLPSLSIASAQAPASTALPDLPSVESPFVLEAVNDPHTGKQSFRFDGRGIPPVIHAFPGQTIQVDYVNHLSANSTELCTHGPCTGMSNLHFHGLHVSPEAPQDDAISMMAMPGQSLQYRVQIPFDQPPGLYWYHTHPHGESYRQLLDGMSGAIVIDGIERYVPQVSRMRERILVLRDAELRPNDPTSARAEAQVELSPERCSSASESPERLFTVNGILRPTIDIEPGEQQFWRIVNASPDMYADLEVDSQVMKVVALDGMPLAFHNPSRRLESRQHVLLSPGGRLEVIVSGPSALQHVSLRTRCVNTGPDGDPNPAMILADLNRGNGTREGATRPHAPAPTLLRNQNQKRPVYKPIPNSELSGYEASEPDYTVRLTEDKRGFYINGHAYAPNDGPMTTVAVGTYQHWHVVNDTHELHPFHIHQVHFLVYSTNGAREKQAEWLDTVNVPVDGSVDLVMDFTDPLIRGMSLFHCHLIQHEDKGMMAKILFR